MPGQAEKIEGSTITHALARFEAEGYRGQFGARPGGEVMCFTCRQPSEAREVRLHASYRVEGPSDPDGEAVVNAVVCPRCQARGTLVLGFGPQASPEDGEVLLALMDRRRPGLLIPAEGVGNYDAAPAEPRP